jgi:hypothetical protein
MSRRRKGDNDHEKHCELVPAHAFGFGAAGCFAKHRHSEPSFAENFYIAILAYLLAKVFAGKKQKGNMLL